MQVAERLTVSSEPVDSPDATIAGTASEIYLGLWNRGSELDVTGDPTLESNVGRVYVLSGADQSSLLTLTGDQENARFGFAVAGGDFNADGTPDVAVGASSYSTVANAFAGKAWIFDGTNGAELYSIEGVTVNDFVGSDIAFVGNVPRDETFAPDIWGDFVIGAPSNLGTRRVIV